MIIKFNEETILTGYIKQLLHSFNLPACKVFNSVNEMVDFYGDKGAIAIIKKYNNNTDYLVRLNGRKIIAETQYSFNKDYLNITTNLSLFNGVYDSKTHIYLGNYLRFLRDYKNIDLMSLYNCYSDLTFTDSTYKYICIPVKYNQPYTIAFDGDISYYFAFDNDLNKIQESFEQKTTTNRKCYFKYPFVLRTGKEESEGSVYKENNYRLIIRAKLSNESPIVVLEKTFKHINNNSLSDSSRVSNMLEKDLIQIQPNFEASGVDVGDFLNNISLLRNKKKYNQPFSSRLVEYLVGNVITPEDKISKDIIDAKYKFYTRYGSIEKRKNVKNGVVRLHDDFTIADKARFLDSVYKSTKLHKDTQDLLGYVDKDVEYCLDDMTLDRGDR